MSVEKNTSPPSVEIYLSPDNLSATINIYPSETDGAPLTAELIHQALAERKIVFGIDQNKLESLINRFNPSQQPIGNEEIARGQYPKPGKKGIPRLLVAALTEKDFVEKLLRENPSPHVSDLKEFAGKFKRVDPGDILAKMSPDQKGQDGTDLFGKPVRSTEFAETQALKAGANVSFKEAELSFHAAASGAAVHYDDTLSVIPLDFNAKFILQDAKNRMEAQGAFYPPGEGGEALSLSDVVGALKKKGIVFGIKEALIAETLARINARKPPEKDVVVAQGQPAIHGAHGKIECFFNTTGTLRPKEMEDGSVNFKEVSMIEAVAESQELVRAHPPTKGKPGRDIFGANLPAMDGTAAKLPAGPNTAPHPSKPDVLVALKAGNVRMRGSSVEVTEGLTIQGDVDYTTGNVHYKMSVLVKNDIKSGFSLESGGDLEVGGLIEDCMVKTEGHVLVRGGFVGNGKGEIDAGGCVNLGFIRNQTVKGRDDVVIAKEAINAKIFARNKISIMGKTLSAVGGKICARREIEGFVFGNEQGTRTELEVGLDFMLIEEKYKCMEKIKELSDSKQKVAENVSKFEKILRIKKSLQPKQEFLYKKLLALSEKIDAQISAIEKRKEMISNKLLDIGKARIVFKTKMYVGTVIKIGERHLIIQKDVDGPKTVMLIEDEIKFI